MNKKCVRALLGLLSGDAFSAFLLNLIMTIWNAHLRRKSSGETMAYLDDRSFWMHSRDNMTEAVRQLGMAMYASREFDKYFGFAENVKQGQFMGTSKDMPKSLDDLQWSYPAAKCEVTILRIDFDFMTSVHN